MNIIRIAAGALLVTVTSANAQTVTDGEYIYEVTQFAGHPEREAIITGLAEGFKPSGNLVFPDSVRVENKSYAVVGVGLGDFSGHDGDDPVILDCPGITSVHIPANIRFIGSNEFLGCPDIVSYTVAEGNKDFKAENGCLIEDTGYEESRWKLFRYPSGVQEPVYAVPTGISYVGKGAFASNRYLKKLHISGEQTLSNCWQLGNHTIESLDLSASRNYHQTADGGIYYANTFVGVCPGVKYDVFTIADNYRYMGSGAFCEAQVREVVIPESMDDYAKERVFMNSTIETITAPHTPCKIASGCFQGCRNLKSITLSGNSDGNLSISSFAFYGCDALETIDFESSVKKVDISWGAFEKCRSLSAFPLTSKMKVKSISPRAFAGCESLTVFPFASVEAFDDDVMGYQFAGSGLTTVNWPSGISRIPGGCFMDCRNLTKVSLKATTAHLGQSCFAGSGLLAISMMGVKNYYPSTFSDCENLVRVYFPEGILESELMYWNIPLIHEDAQIVINNKNVSGLYLQTKYSESSNISLYMSMTSPEQELGSGWKRICVPGRTEAKYAAWTNDQVEPMYSYTTYQDDKAVEVKSLMPEVKIKGVVIEGIDAEYRDGLWVADEAQFADGKMNVTVNYTVNNNVMTTSYEYPHEVWSGIDNVAGESLPEIKVSSDCVEFISTDRWAICDMAGAVVMSGDAGSVSLRSLDSGIYIVKAINGSGQRTGKIRR